MSYMASFVNFLPNQPKYTMHTIKGIESFVDFVEKIADQWLFYLEIDQKDLYN